MGVQVITNNHTRPFVYRYEVPKEVLEWNNHLTEENSFDNWICYKKHWYHVSDFMSLHNSVHCPNPPEFMKGWDGYKSDGFSSGVLIKITDDNEGYKIGFYCS